MAVMWTIATTSHFSQSPHFKTVLPETNLSNKDWRNAETVECWKEVFEPMATPMFVYTNV